MSSILQPSIATLIDLSGRAAVVTGGAKGIGLAIAQRLGEAGAHLHLVDMDKPALDAAKTEMVAASMGVSTYVVDVSSKSAIDQLWDNISGPFPDIVVNNAGIYPIEDFLEVTEDDLMKILNVNTLSQFWMCQSFVRLRGDQGGVIINIGSIESILPFKHDLVPYGLSKAGVASLTRSLTKEYADKGFRVNAILPGGVNTPGAKEISKRLYKLDLSVLKEGYDFLHRLPARRIGQPDDIARMVLVLASDLAVYVHGALIPVDGGFLSA